MHAETGKSQGQLQQVQDAIRQQMQKRLHSAELQLGHAAALTGSLDPYKVLARGYTMVTAANGTILNADDLQPEKQSMFAALPAVQSAGWKRWRRSMRTPKSFEEGMERLNTLLAQMQSEDTTLADSVKLYAEAASLMEYCHAALEKTSLQIDEIDAKLAGTVQEES